MNSFSYSIISYIENSHRGAVVRRRLWQLDGWTSQAEPPLRAKTQLPVTLFRAIFGDETAHHTL
ncbi:MAG TPA: hypothetical protein VJT08_00535 [Terriglobales bacterium]|nr:hypothetical protein [Terriglobales bacterium]